MLKLCFAAALLVGSAQAQEQTPAAGATPPQQEGFPNAPLLQGLVIHSSREAFNSAGVERAAGLVVKDIEILKRREFQKLVTPYFQKPMNEETMKKLQQEIVLYYRRHDRPLVDVLYPEQEVSNGVLQIIVLEARLREVRIEDSKGAPLTNGWAKSKFIRDNVQLVSGDVIREKQLISDVDWLNRNPFRKAQVMYQSSGKFAESDVVLRVEERMPLSVFAGYEDTGSRITGRERVLAGFTTGATWGRTEHLLNYQFTGDPNLDNLRAHSASYALGLPWRHTLRLIGSYLEVEGTVDKIFDLEGTSYQTSMRYEVPLPVIGKYQHEASIGLDYKNSDNNLAFNAFSVANTPTEVFQIAAGYSGVLRDNWGQTAATLQGYYSPGDVTEKNTDTFFGGTLGTNGLYEGGAHGGAKAEYMYSRITAERSTRLPWDMSWVVRGLVQFADGNLIPSEQLGLGGYATARGYEEREANTDQGWLISNELRSPAFSLGSLLKKKDQMQLLVFWDYGVGENKHLLIDDEGNREDPHILFNSVGCGLRYTISRYLSVRFDYGWQLADSGQDRTPSTATDPDGKRRQRSRAHVGAVVSF